MDDRLEKVERRVQSIEEAIEKIVKESMKVKLDVYDKVEEFRIVIEQRMRSSNEHHTMLEKSIDSLVLKSQELPEWFKEHDRNEMEKYDNINNSLTELTSTLKQVIKETSDNSNAISQEKHAKELEEAKQKAIEEYNKPAKERKEKILNAVYTSIAIAAVGTLGTGILFIYDLYKKFNGE